MKKINLLVITLVFLVTQTMVFSNDLRKAVIEFKGDTVKKCTETKIEVKELEAAKALIIKVTVPSAEIGPKLGELYSKLTNYLKEKGAEMAGPTFAIYHKWDPQGNTEMEAGVPVLTEIESEGDIQYVELPATKVVTALYVGPYDAIGPVYEDIQKYIKEKGLEIKGSSWEEYLTDPGKEPDPNKYKTQVYFPVK